jgi:hypothetical protein
MNDYAPGDRVRILPSFRRWGDGTTVWDGKLGTVTQVARMGKFIIVQVDGVTHFDRGESIPGFPFIHGEIERIDGLERVFEYLRQRIKKSSAYPEGA